MRLLALRYLSITQYRSYARLVIECDARPLALYGANGAGKTNLLEAVSMFSPGRGLRRARAQTMTQHPCADGWGLSALVQGASLTHEIAMRADHAGTRQLRINQKTASQTQLGKICRILWLVPAMDRLWSEGASPRRRFLDRMTLSFFPDHGEAVLAYEKSLRERNRLLKEQRRDSAWYNAIEAQMAAAAVRIQSYRRQAIAHLCVAQQKTLTAFPVADVALERTTDRGATSVADFQHLFAESRARDLLAGRSLCGPHGSDMRVLYAAKGIEGAACSTGEQKALLISLLLANARALASDCDTTPILLLDEVAAHLDPNRRLALYDEISALKIQAWMSGTEAALFAPLGGRAQYIEITHDGSRSLAHKRTPP